MTHLCTDRISSAVLDCHCAGRPFKRIYSRKYNKKNNLYMIGWEPQKRDLKRSQSRTSGCLVTSGRYWPRLLMRSGIPRKGLPPQWQSNTAVETQYRGESPSFPTSIIYIQITIFTCN